MNGFENGFTLIELMIVVAIIGILSAVAFPNYQDYRSSAQMAEGLRLKQPYRDLIQEFYAHRGYFPSDNTELGIPAAEHLRGQYVESILIRDGSIEVTYTSEVISADLEAGKLVDTPCVNVEYPSSPIVWNCRSTIGLKDAKAYKPVEELNKGAES